jgi:hypothetical protein
MNFNKIYRQADGKSAKNDTDALKGRNNNNAKYRRIYQISNMDGKKAYQDALLPHSRIFSSENQSF